MNYREFKKLLENDNWSHSFSFKETSSILVKKPAPFKMAMEKTIYCEGVMTSRLGDITITGNVTFNFIQNETLPSIHVESFTEIEGLSKDEVMNELLLNPKFYFPIDEYCEINSDELHDFIFNKINIGDFDENKRTFIVRPKYAPEIHFQGEIILPLILPRNLEDYDSLFIYKTNNGLYIVKHEQGVATREELVYSRAAVLNTVTEVKQYIESSKCFDEEELKEIYFKAKFY